MKLSVVIPVYNERENVRRLYDALSPVLRAMPHEHEILLVDDGSTDGSFEELERLAAIDGHVKVVRFRRNFGQTAAMNAGLHMASGDVIVTMDADLQNDPADIPLMLDKLAEGYDLVHGWRKNRQDAWVNRKLPSKIANWVISRVTGFPVHDLGCTLKAMRREVAQDLQLYGEMHRFIPILAHWRGARCAEVVTRHHPRRFGKSKYGISRTLRVLLDLITVKYMIQYLASPMRLFGKIGLVSILVGLLAGVTTIAMKIGGGVDMTGNPLLLLTVFAEFVGLQFIVLGMLGELGVRTYYESQGKTPYTIRELINFDAPALLPPVSISRRAA
jgi:glycosyltransferase involved in cell wall biosynthesis